MIEKSLNCENKFKVSTRTQLWGCDVQVRGTYHRLNPTHRTAACATWPSHTETQGTKKNAVSSQNLLSWCEDLPEKSRCSTITRKSMSRRLQYRRTGRKAAHTCSSRLLIYHDNQIENLEVGGDNNPRTTVELRWIRRDIHCWLH